MPYSLARRAAAATDAFGETVTGSAVIHCRTGASLGCTRIALARTRSPAVRIPTSRPYSATAAAVAPRPTNASGSPLTAGLTAAALSAPSIGRALFRSRVRNVWIALATLFGFAAGYVVTAIVTLFAFSGPECDGPCFSEAEEYFGLAIIVAIVSGIVCGLLTRRAIR